MKMTRMNTAPPFFLCFAGMGFCFAWKGLVSEGSGAADDAVVRLVVPFAAALAWSLLTPAVRGRWIAGCTGAAASLGTVLAWGSIWGADPLCCQIGSVLIVAGNLLLLLYWTEFYALLNVPLLVLVLAVAYLAGPLLYFMVEAIPEIFAPGLAAAFPLASAACLCASLSLVRRGPAAPKTLSFAIERSAANAVARMRENQRKTGYPWQPVAVVAAYAFAFGINRNYTTVGVDLASQAMAGLALLLMVAFVRRFNIHRVIQAALPLVMLGLLLGVLFGGSHPGAQVLINACYAFSAVSLIVLLCNRAHRFEVSAIWLNGFARTATGAAFLLGMGAERLAQEAPLPLVDAGQAVYGITLVVVALATFFWFVHAKASDLASEGIMCVGWEDAASECLDTANETPPRDRRQEAVQETGRIEGGASAESQLWLNLVKERCDELAQEYRLSRRESEVLELLARGRSAPRIEEELVLSNSTVKTHIRHIYSKLDIHSRDELKILLAIE